MNCDLSKQYYGIKLRRTKRHLSFVFLNLCIIRNCFPFNVENIFPIPKYIQLLRKCIKNVELLSVVMLSVIFTLSVDGPTVCQHHFQEASRNTFPGIYIPDCKPSGGYEDVQCRGSYCFCVDKRGNELKGTRMSVSEGRPRCDRPGTTSCATSLTRVKIHAFL